MLYWLIQESLSAYIYSTVTFLLLCLLFKKLRQNVSSFLSISNGIVLIVVSINLCFAVFETVKCRLEQIEYLNQIKVEGYDFYYSNNCFITLLSSFFLAFLFQAPFIFKKHRQKVWLTILSIISLVIVLNLERIVILIMTIFRQSLFTSWFVYYDSTDKFWRIAFTAFYFTLCLLYALFGKKYLRYNKAP